MALYNEKLKGYIADVPRVVFKRCDGKKWYFDELTAATVSADIQTIDINAGWSLFPVAVLPGQSTFTMNFTSGQFDPEMFAMANKTEYELVGVDQNDPGYLIPQVDRATISATNKIAVLTRKAIEGSIYIEGLEETDGTPTPKSGNDLPTYKVDYTKDYPTVTFPTGIDGTVEIIYEYRRQNVKVAMMTNREAAIGEATAIWPVYGTGDDCSQSDIIGYYVVKVFRARVTTVPGMDTSYKSAATFQFELTALDAKMEHGEAYSTAYFKRNNTD